MKDEGVLVHCLYIINLSHFLHWRLSFPYYVLIAFYIKKTSSYRATDILFTSRHSVLFLFVIMSRLQCFQFYSFAILYSEITKPLLFCSFLFVEDLFSVGVACLLLLFGFSVSKVWSFTPLFIVGHLLSVSLHGRHRGCRWRREVAIPLISSWWDTNSILMNWSKLNC